MTEPIAPLAAPPTVEVVSVRVAEQLMSDMYRRIADLESRLEAVEREADEAEAAMESYGDGEVFASIAEQLREAAADLRARAHRPGASDHDSAPVVRLPTARTREPDDQDG